MPGGYFIYNAENDIVSFELTKKTEFNFVDSSLLFVKDEKGDRKYTTTDKDKFISHLTSVYTDSPPAQNVPFFMEVADGKVVSVMEDARFTN